MIKHTLTAAALATVLAIPAYAQSTAPSATPPTSAQSAPAAPARVRAAVAMVSAPVAAKLEPVAAKAIAKARPATVALLDRKLLSDATLGSLSRGARNEVAAR